MTASLGLIEQRLRNIPNPFSPDSPKGLPGGMGRKVPAAPSASADYSFDLCVFAASSRAPVYLSTTLESLFKYAPVDDACPAAPSLRPRRTLVLFDTQPGADFGDPEALFEAAGLRPGEAEVTVVGTSSFGDLDPSK